MQPPHQIYRREFVARVLADAPASVLDVGCGEGGFLADLAARGIRAVGVDHESALAAARAAGLEVHAGVAERLPFDDASFDTVTFMYVTHHVADPAVALAEAARVARKSVHVLDGWYELSVPSQRVAHAFDLWAKAIDERGGMVHRPCPVAGDLLPPLEAAGYEVDLRHALVLRLLGLDAMERQAAARLNSAFCDAAARARYAVLHADAARDGFSDDGAILVRAAR